MCSCPAYRNVCYDTLRGLPDLTTVSEKEDKIQF